MYVEKVSSNLYRVKKIHKGKTYRLTFDHKPTKNDIVKALADLLENNVSTKSNATFEECAEEYIRTKQNVISPSTIVGYKSIVKNLSDNFKRMKVDDITTLDIQREVNDYAAPHPERYNSEKLVTRSPKSVRNAHGFISSVLGTFRPKLDTSSTLPQKAKNEVYIPSDNDVKRILEAVADSEYENAFKLLCFGLRRSELLAVTDKSIELKDGIYILHIKDAIVINENKEWVSKTTKTTESTRDLAIPKDLAESIIKDGYVYNGYPNNINRELTRRQNELGIPHFSVHKFRHFFCSKLVEQGYDIKTIQALGGWVTDDVPRKVYSHVNKDKYEKVKLEATQSIATSLF